MRIASMLALSLLVLVGPISMSPAVAVAPRTADDSQARTVHRAYGDGPVKLGKADILNVRFFGKAGDRVRLRGNGRCPLSLHGPYGQVVPNPGGFLRLEDLGVQTFTLTRCAALDNDAELQLQKLRVVHGTVDGPGLRVRARRGYVEALRMRVPASGRLMVTALGSDESGPAFDGTWLPDGTWFRLGGYYAGTETYFFEAGYKIYGSGGPLRGAGGGGALQLTAGDRLLLVMSGSGTVWQSVAKNVAVTIDAPATTLPPSEVPYREYELDFQGQAGSWVHLEIARPVGVLPDIWRLLGPDGHQFQRFDYWRLPKTGVYRLMVPTAPTTQPIVVRLRSIVQLGTPVPTDGTHVTLTTTDPGRWVVAPMTLDTNPYPPLYYQLVVHSAVADGPWTAMATVAGELTCSRTAMSCGEFASGTVGPTSTTSIPFGGNGPDWVVLLMPNPGVTANVELSVSPAP